ncbi:MAG: hypothetical protein KJ645_02545, partial [Planctomycetes bacterium]|nr:hypothetical protein [Planctomycetota bacterium]
MGNEEKSGQPTKVNYIERQATKDDFQALIDVYNRAYGKNKDTRTFEWKYLQNPHGEASMWVAESDAK